MGQVLKLVAQVTHSMEPRKAQGLVEYSLIIGLVAVFLIAGLMALGSDLEGLYDRVHAAFEAIPL